MRRIKIHFMETAEAARAGGKKEKWSQHNSLERGCVKACFKGDKFEKI